MALEILLESGCFRRITEGDGDFNPPRQMVCCRPHVSRIVLLQSALEATGEAGVVAVRVINADELINVVEHNDGLPGRSPIDGTKPGGW
jgi:hypothetical protein